MEKRAWSWLQSGLAENLSLGAGDTPTWHVWKQVHLIWDQRLDCLFLGKSSPPLGVASVLPRGHGEHC